ncbi:c-type cytochrome [Uliginosibacterium paludis]|uniref:C-type cytochrome n=1 Tax=Uliginosibacterium paludis TaxID=1615952 RepID=A0ABV2CSA9_9RHOO
MNKVSRLSLPVLALGIASLLLACSKGKVDEEKTAELIQPVARVEMAAPAPVAESTGPKSAEDIVAQVCSACHGTGAAGAPKIGDKAAWAPRIAQGMDTLVQHALQGKGAMPAKGGNPALSDDEVKAAVALLVKQAK